MLKAIATLFWILALIAFIFAVFVSVLAIVFLPAVYMAIHHHYVISAIWIIVASAVILLIKS